MQYASTGLKRPNFAEQLRRYDPDGPWLPKEPVLAARVQQWLSIAAGQLAWESVDGPQGGLSMFNGQNANGTWTLKVQDGAGGDVGELPAQRSFGRRVVGDTLSRRGARSELLLAENPPSRHAASGMARSKAANHGVPASPGVAA